MNDLTIKRVQLKKLKKLAEQGLVYAKLGAVLCFTASILFHRGWIAFPTAFGTIGLAFVVAAICILVKYIKLEKGINK
jgi:Kef-type K+ transport system membrane component KefB